MPTIPQKQLRNSVGEVLRRAEAGEEFTITVSGRPVAQLGPLQPQRWVPVDHLQELWSARKDPTFANDLAGLGEGSVDPFES